MNASIESRGGRAALMVAHCAGMVDLVALSVWVGALIAHYRFDAQQAGMLPTLFLSGVVLASVALAPRFHRLPTRAIASTGFALSALGFWLAAGVTSFGGLAALHAACGVATGAALSVTHGTIARSANPHRLFALVGVALGVFAVVFLGAMPQVIAARGGASLFLAFAAVMAIGAIVSGLAFPRLVSTTTTSNAAAAPLPRVVWFGIAGIACMTVVQAMTFGFLEAAGLARGFDRQAINLVLIALGLVNLLPAVLAALLQKRIPARRVLLAGPAVQAVLAATIMASPAFGPYAVAASLLAAVLIFTHTFAFGLLARLDLSGRTLAGTPAMLMIGSAIGPLLGGTLVKAFGYASLAGAAVLLALMAIWCFSRLPAAADAPPTAGALS